MRVSDFTPSATPVEERLLRKFSKLFDTKKLFKLQAIPKRRGLGQFSFFGAAHMGRHGYGAHPRVAQALVRTLGEVIERACHVPRPPRFEARTYRELKARGLRCLDPESFRIFSDDQSSVASGLAANLDRTARTDWTWFESATSSHEPVLLPNHFDIETSHGHPFHGSVTSSGNACATESATAKLRAVCELIERDAILLYWWTRNTPKRIDLKKLSPKLEKTLALFGRYEDRVTLLYLPTEFGIPVIVGTYRGTKKNEPMFGISAGCNFDAESAIESALLELLLCVGHPMEFLDIVKGTNYDVDFDRTVWGFDDRKVLYALTPMEDAYGFLLRQHGKPLNWRAIPSESFEHSDDALREAVSRVASRGCRLYFKDLTLPTYVRAGFSVYRAVSPDLVVLDAAHHLRNAGCARLYRAPAELGLKRRPRSFGELNPFPHPFA